MAADEELLDVDGMFWWSTDKASPGFICPPAAVGGRLKVSGDGLSRLELIGTLTAVPDVFMNMLQPNKILDKAVSIHGVLRNGGAVVLGRLRRNGSSVVSMGLSSEGYIALDCQVYSGESRPAQRQVFRSLQLDLTQLDDWFHVRSIDVTPKRSGYQLRVNVRPAVEYQVGDDRLSISFAVSPSPKNVSYARIVKSADIRQSILLNLRYRRGKDIAQHRADAGHVEDLLFLLTGLRVRLPWPVLSNGTRRCTYYYARDEGKSEPVKWNDCWTAWGQIKPSFGEYFTALRRQRDELGPGLYLYLGTRRMSKLFLENQFVNLIWGLESLHRRALATPVATANKLQQKIDRILGQIALAKDKQWLSERLKNAAEPSLGERLTELFRELPLQIEPGRLRAFGIECARIRNDISHFGGARHNSYEDFSARLRLIMEVLPDLYHALLMQRVGLQLDLIQAWFKDGVHSYGYRKLFSKLGLLPPADVDPEPEV